MGSKFGSGVLTAQYEYDSWGNVLSIKDGTGNNVTGATHIGTLNPFRYRGYYMDAETGLYYLVTRYYDSVTHRFINADGYFQTGQGFLDKNMSAYCENNPIMFVDPMGTCKQFSLKPCLSSSCLINQVKPPQSKPPIDTQSPPPPETGYKSPDKKKPSGKKDKKVKNPNGQGKGYPSSNPGNPVWVPDNNMDGGPGWVRQYPDGTHDHVYPNGHKRVHTIDIIEKPDAAPFTFNWPEIPFAPPTGDPKAEALAKAWDIIVNLFD